jgi:flagellar motor switch/type III secretory pathway protein FliN
MTTDEEYFEPLEPAMMVDDEDFPPVASRSELEPWSIFDLRKIQYDLTGTAVYARQAGFVQYSQDFQSPTAQDLTIRYVQNFPHVGGLGGHVWMQAITEWGAEIDLAIDPAYIFERTGCLVSPKAAHWGGGDLVPLYDIVCMAISDLAMVFSLSLVRFLTEDEVPSKVPSNYLALDHRRYCKVVITSDDKTLNRLDQKFRWYNPNFWADYQSMGRIIRIPTTVLIYPTRSLWTAEELASLEEGDLLSIQNYRTPKHGVRLRGAIRFRNHKNVKKQFEVFLEMNEEDTVLHYGSDDLSANSSDLERGPVAPMEEIELEIHAGKTTVLFNDLCTVQAGTLIELREHALPFVKLCVMGSPILEGELVTFQDQVMIQITKRLD